MKFKLGDRVWLNKEKNFWGYIVRIECDPFEEVDVEWESKEWVTYVIRVYRSFYTDGYTDFYRSANDISLV